MIGRQVWFKSCGLALALASSPAPAQLSTPAGSGGFEWRVKDRFRLFDQASQGARDRVDLLLDRLAAAPDEPLSTHYEQFLEVLADRDGSEAHTAELRLSHYVPAPDKAPRRSGRYDRHYLYPRSYVLEFRDLSRKGRMCAYASSVAEAAGACEIWTALRVPAGSNKVLGVGGQGDVRVQVDGIQASVVAYRFVDQTVVALGDSFISGEGNPDRPSLIRAEEPDTTFERPSWGAKVKFAKQLLRKAEWWDEACHRSLLSWPVLATLAHAARDPHRAVTLVHLGCSGAVVDDIVRHGETDLPGGGDETDSQLALLDSLLLRPTEEWLPRPVDKVLLSIGGNDIGFVGVLTTLTLPPNGFTLGPVATGLIGKEAAAVCPYKRSGRPLERLCRTRVSAEERVARLSPAYARLSERLRRFPVGSVHHALYPNPLIGEGGRPCDNNPANDQLRGKRPEFGGFEALMGIFPKKARGFRFSSWNFEIQYYPEENLQGLLYPDRPEIGCDRVQEESDSEVCQGLLVHRWLNDEVGRSGFPTIAGHVTKIDGHGLCVVGDGPSLSLPLATAGSWRGKTPSDFDPYGRYERGRWFRVPNDSILTQFDIYDGAPRFHQGTIHPTFRSHVEYAEAALREALLK